MFQGTGSDVGKSLIVAGLCRALLRRGMAPAPFKPQNMANNASPTREGGEIGRAQALQARAARRAPSVDMNPVLLKPEGEGVSQIIVQGQVFGKAGARDYYRLKPQLLPRVMESYRRLGNDADMLLVEGAGSPAEVNLRAGDIANMGFAVAADVPVVLVADIDRGGVLAAVLGTVELLPGDERARIIGYIVNKFRGDETLFHPALEILQRRTGLECLGILPWFGEAHLLPAEDGMTLDRRLRQTPPSSASTSAATGETAARRPIRIAVPRYPRIANFDDLDPLSAEPGVVVEIIRPGEALPGDADLVLLPGSKATIDDLAALRQAGWDIDIRAHLRRGGRVLGICGGYQMLGQAIADPDGLEGPARTVEGLGLLQVKTVLKGPKTIREISGRLCATGAGFSGYEIHMGESEGADRVRAPLIRDGDGYRDGAASPDGLVEGIYVHGIFAADGFRRDYLTRLDPGHEAGPAFEARIDGVLDRLAAHMERHLAIDRLIAAARG